jgi:transcriptional regulator with XRE-family HTH domain
MNTDQSAGGAHGSGWESTIRLGQRLRRLRLSRNLTQAEVAKNLFSVSYVSGVERGQIRPSLAALEHLANRLQVPLVELATEGGFDTHSHSAPVKHRSSPAERHREEVERTFLVAQVFTYQKKSTEAIALLLRLERTHVPPPQRAMVMLLLAICYNQQGRAEEAHQLSREALDEIEYTEEHELLARLRCELGRAFSALGDHAAALEQYQMVANGLQETVQDPAEQVRMLLHIGREQWLLSEHEQAISVLTQASEVAGEVLQREHLGAVYWTLSQRMAEDGDQVGAKCYATRSLGAYDTAERWRSINVLYTRLGMALARSGQQEEALTYLQIADRLAVQQGDLEGRAETQSALAVACLDDNHPCDAYQAASAALQAAERLQDTNVLGHTLLIVAQVQEACKQPEEASHSYERAIELWHSLPMMPVSQQLREAYAQFSGFLERQGDSQRAYEMLKQAYMASQQS